jgi:hypothetical protein
MTGRWLDRTATAQYISVRVDQLPRLVRRGFLPAPSYHLGERSPRWDREALDARFAGSVASPALAHDLAVQDAVNDILGKGRQAAAR